MDIRMIRDGDTVVLKVKGKLNTVTAPDFNKFVGENIKGPCKVNVDFGELDFMTSVGIRSLMSLRSIVGADNIRVINAKGLVREVFEVSGITAILGD